MGKRIVAIFSTVLILLTICAGRVLALSLWDDTLAQTAANQQQYTLSIPTGRGNFYDRSGKALTGNGKKRYLAAVAPDQQAAAALQKVLPVSRMAEVADLLESGKPFLVSLDAPVQADSVVCVPQTMRYSSAAPAAHLIGYLDGGGHGVSGLEKAYDELLGSGSGGTTVTYTVDALGHFLAGEKPVVVTQEMQAPEGIALTLDADLQKTVEQAADRYLQKGAVVVLEAGSGQILASTSVPAFDPSDVAASMKDTDGPFVNRALQPYTVGSVFKLAAASAALESGQNPDAPYTCTGAQEVEGRLFHCYGGEAHGVVTMRQAIAQSCNSYFVHLMQSVQPASFLHMAQLLGFGEKDTLAPGFAAAAGELPTLRSLASKQALANFSFGQGVLTATPLQVAAMVNAVASGGMYTTPSIVVGERDVQTGKVDAAAKPESHAAISQKTASLLTSYMRDCVETGTGKDGKPAHVTAAAKTATAQTGRIQNGQEENICWYAGFFPAEQPRYVVAVMSEGGASGGKVCGPVFRQIADTLYPKSN